MAFDIEGLIKEWWDNYQADPRAKFDNIVSGMRKPQHSVSNEVKYDGGVTQPISRSQKQTGACQYFINGLPAVCKHWDHELLSCVFGAEEEEGPQEIPSGYGLGKCDMLGRRKWCSKYEPSVEENLTEFVCVAPCVERSGLGKQLETESETLSYRALLPNEIQGYNASDTGVGQCDGWGLGRGFTLDTLEDLYKYGPICRYYRPQQMGFGAIQPRPYHGSDVAGKPYDGAVNWIPETLKKLHDGSNADPFTILDKRLPFVFQVYNARAMYQKCAHWKNMSPSFFVVSPDSDPSLQTIIMDGDNYCEYDTADANNSATPFYSSKEEWRDDIPWMLSEVIAEYGGVICNGAKPECPCYTGKWIYCIDNNMRDGMRISADQLFELRFWASDWASQKEYDAYYMQKPGRSFEGYSDESTASVYTFTKWDRLDITDPNNSIMLGYEHTMCMPAPLHLRCFIPSVYITKKLYRYPKLNSYTGTNKAGNVAFPTLVRELEDPADYVPDIFVVYPYTTIDPWASDPCQQGEVADFCLHNSNLMSNPYISVVGQTVANCDIFIVNLTLIEENADVVRAKEYIDKYTRAGQITDLDTWYNYNYRMEKLLDYCEEQKAGYNTSTTGDYGFFKETNIELQANSLNELYILCKYSTDPFPEYAFRKVKVKAIYWAAVIRQTAMTHTHYEEIGYVDYPHVFIPAASLAGEVFATTGTVSKVFPIYKYKSVGFYGNKYNYGYCINEYTVDDEDVEHWVQVGPTGYIWAEIDNVQLSYLWGFSVTEAYMKLEDPGDDTVNLCDEDNTNKEDIKIPLTNVSISRKTIPPNAVLLKAAKPMGFFNSDWKLVIKYKYQVLETFMADSDDDSAVVKWPQGLDNPYGYNRFRSSPFDVEHNYGGSSFRIPAAGGPTSKATFSVMAFIVDGDLRVQAAAATKLVVQGYKQGNRNVEITYGYNAPAKAFAMQPEFGFFTWLGPPKTISDESKAMHHSTAMCGDHNCDTNNCIGPMWYPFDGCSTLKYYDTYNPAAYCILPETEGEEAVKAMGKGAFRYETAPEYMSWVGEAGGNWLQTCSSLWSYYYSKALSSDMAWAGTIKIRRSLNTSSFEVLGWTLPPFGNSGRESMDRFLSKDFCGFLNYSQSFPFSDSIYMPLVFTAEELVTNPDCFSGGQFSGGNISYFPMMSNYTAGHITESILLERYRFEDILQTVIHTNCSYPDNLIRVNGSYYVARYCFKNEDHVYAWPEYWENIERNVSSDYGKFTFMELYRPSYYFDALDKEHRFITEEGSHTLIFEPPVPSTDGEDDSTDTYPSISIDGRYPRYFKIVYPDYSDGYADWQDESENGEVGSSGGENIYELANNGDTLNVFASGNDIPWVHDFNTIFDSNASDEPSIERMYCLGYEKFGYYNRGLIVNIPKNRLKFLPMETVDAGNADNEKYEDGLYIGYWALNTYGIVPTEVSVEGYYGRELMADGSEEVYDRPSISVAESEEAPEYDELGFPVFPESTIGYIRFIDGKTLSSLKKYDIKLELDKTPNRMTQTLRFFMIKLSALPGQRLNVKSIEVKTSRYVRAEEQIYVFERKYYVGGASLSAPNADGPNSGIYRTAQTDRENSGQFFPMNAGGAGFGSVITGYDNNGNPAGGDGEILFYSPSASTSSLEEAGSVISKFDMASFNELAETDELVDDVSMDNLKDKERDVQKELFDEAVNLDGHSTLNFSGLTPPALETWLNYINSGLPACANMILQYNTLKWDESKYPAQLKQDADFWQPGGHYFSWSDSIFKTKCYTMGDVQDVYSAKYIHYRHGGDEDVIDPGHAYAGWGRTEYYEAVLGGREILGIQDQPTEPDLLTGARNGIMV